MEVTKVLTFKSGNFPFSYNYSHEKVRPLEIEFHFLYNSLSELPILPAQLQEFEKELTRRSIFSTAAIEGNPLKEEEVAEIINDVTPQNHAESKKIEIINLQKAYQEISEIHQSSDFVLSEDFIKTLHKTVTCKLKYDYCIPGVYRNHVVKVGDKPHGGIATPPKCLKDIQNLMGKYIEWFHSDEVKKLPPIIQSTIAHYHLALIHPFGDGNGRTARLVEAAILRSAGIKYLPTMLSNYYYREIDNYFISFSNCHRNKDKDISPFIEFVLSGAVESLNEVKSRITTYIRRSALKNYFYSLNNSKEISKRQLELLNLLLDAQEDEIVTIKSVQRELPYRTLYAKVTDRTARRDLTKLHEKKILALTQKGYKLDRQILNITNQFT